MLQEKALKPLNIFFKIATFTFALSTFSFGVVRDDTLWILWRDKTSLAFTLLGISLLMGVGWWFTARRRRAPAYCY